MFDPGHKPSTLRRLTFAALVVLWAAVTIAAFGFHHHEHGEEECQQSLCPFALVISNIPALLCVLLSLYLAFSRERIAEKSPAVPALFTPYALPSRAPPLLHV